MSEKLAKYGLQVPDILLPAKGTDLSKWAVVACDQFTSEPDYWEKAKEIANDSPSTLQLIFPEIYLKDSDKDQRINNINAKMEEYLVKGTLQPQKPGFILVDRKTSHSPSRKGLIAAFDLEKYDYSAGSSSLIRATEGTVLDRIPPRVKIRENAAVELPHIMILIDDPGRKLIEPLFSETTKLACAYDFELMLDGGHIKGYKVEDAESISRIEAALEQLADPDNFKAKYGVGDDKGVLLFAVGDGNHSLASAKAHWENVKADIKSSNKSDAEKTALLEGHPARFALAELINVHDDGIIFEPIHRVLFGVKLQNVLEKYLSFFESANVKSAGYKLFNTREEMTSALNTLSSSSIGQHIIPFVAEKQYGILVVENPCCNLEVGTLQTFLDSLVKSNPDIEIDYIHGDQVVEKLGSDPGCMGFFLPSMSKQDLFKTVILEGVLPRKTFSMGEAEEKRYYLECRKIK